MIERSKNATSSTTSLHYYNTMALTMLTKDRKSLVALFSKSNDWEGFHFRMFLFLPDSTILSIQNYAAGILISGKSKCHFYLQHPSMFMQS